MSESDTQSRGWREEPSFTEEDRTAGESGQEGMDRLLGQTPPGRPCAGRKRRLHQQHHFPRRGGGQERAENATGLRNASEARAANHAAGRGSEAKKQPPPPRRRTSRPSSRAASKPSATSAAAAATGFSPSTLFAVANLVGSSLAAAAASTGLRPQSELTSGCFGFPARNFDPENCVKAVNGGHTPYLPMEAGDDAIDFTLHDLRGEAWSLAETLNRTDAPVVMIWGMITCPGFQGYGTEPPWDMDSYGEEYELVELYKGRATFVHLYGPEPHPKIPGTNFDKGTTWPHYWSVVAQHRSYEDRVAMANQIAHLVHADQVILPDYFPGNPYSDLVQPVWCSYAMAARAVIMIAPSGKLHFQRAWFHAEHVGRAIDKYWCDRLAEGGDGGRGSMTLQEWWPSYSPSSCDEVENAEGDGGEESWPDGVPPLAGVLGGAPQPPTEPGRGSSAPRSPPP